MWRSDGGAAAGFTQLHASFCSVAANPVWTLYDLFVAPEGRRQGVKIVPLQSSCIFTLTGEYFNSNRHHDIERRETARHAQRDADA